MIKIIIPDLAMRNEWIRFLDRNFGYESPDSYAIDFAPIVDEKNLSNVRMLLDEGIVASSAALYPREVIVGNKPVLRMGIIGAVASDEKFRGKGYSKKIIEEIEMLAIAQNLDGLFLWSDQKEFYERMGFKEIGIQKIYSLYQMSQPTSKIAGRVDYSWDINSINLLYQKHSSRIARNAAYWQEIQKIKSCNRAQWVDSSGKILAYIGYNRGKDMQGIVHEWGGDRLALQWLVYNVNEKMLSQEKDLFWLTSPSLKEDPILELLFDSDEALVEQGLGFFKPLKLKMQDYASVLDQVWFWGLDSM